MERAEGEQNGGKACFHIPPRPSLTLSEAKGQGKKRSNELLATNHQPLATALQLIQHRFHLALRMAIAFTSRRESAVAQISLGLIRLAGFVKRLRGHEISRGIIRMMLKQRIELTHGLCEFSRLGIFHGQAVSRERILWVLCQEFSQHLDTFTHGNSIISASPTADSRRPRALLSSKRCLKPWKAN